MRLPFFNRSQAKDSYPTDDALTEDPERQRARHRLLGAVFLVFIAVVGLPLIFDSKPKQYNNDVVIQIIQPGAKNEKPSEASVEKLEKKAEESKESKEPKKDTKELVETKKEEPKPEKLADKSAEKAPAVAKTLDKGEEVLTILEDRKPTAKAGTGKFIIHIGAFSSEARVKNWQAKLKEQKVNTYLDSKTNKEGVKLYLLRSGPYADKASADAADKKIHTVGLSSRIVEQKSE